MYMDLQQGSSKCLNESKCRHILWFPEGPVPRGKGSSQSDLTKGKDEVTNPEQTKQMVDLDTQHEAGDRDETCGS